MSETTIISLENVSIYQQKNLVLENVNFQIKDNEFVYLIGRVGSGKSSLIKTLYAELPLKQGIGNVAGFELHKLKKSQIPYLRRKIGIVFQDFQLLTDRNIKNNLLFVLNATGWTNKIEMQTRIEQVLTLVQLLDKINKMPHQLSGGEQQRIVIARALLNTPEIILADEPTGNLDPESSDIIMNLLIEIQKNDTAIVMATHNYQLLKKFPFRTLKCDCCKITESKSPEELIGYEM